MGAPRLYLWVLSCLRVFHWPTEKAGSIPSWASPTELDNRRNQMVCFRRRWKCNASRSYACCLGKNETNADQPNRPPPGEIITLTLTAASWTMNIMISVSLAKLLEPKIRVLFEYSSRTSAERFYHVNRIVQLWQYQDRWDMHELGTWYYNYKPGSG